MTEPTDQLYQLPTDNRSQRHKTLLFSALGIAGAFYAGAATAASWIASRLHYAPALGLPIPFYLPAPARPFLILAASAAFATAAFRRQWVRLPAHFTLLVATVLLTSFPLYPPSTFFLARKAFSGTAYEPLVSSAILAGLTTVGLIGLSLAPFLILYLRRLVKTGDLHGSARFATPTEILSGGFILDDPNAALSLSSGIPIGTIHDRGRRRLVRVKGDTHFLAIAPPGAGKSTGLVIPALQDWESNAFVLDVKGELLATTAGHRKLHGSRILILDPSRNDPSLARYNPLTSVKPYPYDVVDVMELAQILIPDQHKGSDPFWSQSARTLLEGILLHVLYLGPIKTLGACYRTLCDPLVPLDDLFQAMLQAPHDPSGANGWTTHPRVAMAARTLLDMPGMTRGGVIANAQASLSTYADPILDLATSASDFSLSDLYLRQDRPVTLYMVIDPNSLHRLAQHVRIVVSQLTSALTRELPTVVDRRPVLLVLDEFPTFGRMEVLEIALAYLRGYGVQVYIVIQHFGQLVAAYGQTEGISPNCAVHLAFAPSHLDTAKQLSARAGQRTVSFERGGVSTQGLFKGTGHSFQQADSARPLLAPDEILRLPKGQALVLRSGCRPLLVTPVPYYTDPRRTEASRLDQPVSEPTHPDLSHWLSRLPGPPVVLGKRERRSQRSSVLAPEKAL
jgi:type IV secretion system protein VirD4